MQDSLKQWVPAAKLQKGEHLKTPDGTLAVADGGTTPKVHDGWMWDLTVPGNNDHDFYVEPVAFSGLVGHTSAAIPVLVHNCDEADEDLLNYADDVMQKPAQDREGAPKITTADGQVRPSRMPEAMVAVQK